ncbi:YtxH domain-containing protein [Myxococcota bacterium]|nr:YtxH domain-containing protein [Myxococcota bacterium]
MKPLIASIVGGIAGYVWYTQIGCQGGACVLSNNVVMSVFWGAVGGFLIVAP